MEPELLSEENQPSTVSLASAISNEVIEATPELQISQMMKSHHYLMTPQKCPIFPLIMIYRAKQYKLLKTTTAAPIPQFNGRIWPWPAKQAWDERQVYRGVVAMRTNQNR